MQRFKRLEAELAELKIDLNDMEKSLKNGESDKPEGYEPTTLMSEVENLQKQINSLHLQSIGTVTDLDSKEKKCQKRFDYKRKTL